MSHTEILLQHITTLQEQNSQDESNNGASAFNDILCSMALVLIDVFNEVQQSNAVRVSKREAVESLLNQRRQTIQQEKSRERKVPSPSSFKNDSQYTYNKTPPILPEIDRLARANGVTVNVQDNSPSAIDSSLNKDDSSHFFDSSMSFLDGINSCDSMISQSNDSIIATCPNTNNDADASNDCSFVTSTKSVNRKTSKGFLEVDDFFVDSESEISTSLNIRNTSFSRQKSFRKKKTYDNLRPRSRSVAPRTLLTETDGRFLSQLPIMRSYTTGRLEIVPQSGLSKAKTFTKRVFSSDAESTDNEHGVFSRRKSKAQDIANVVEYSDIEADSESIGRSSSSSDLEFDVKPELSDRSFKLVMDGMNYFTASSDKPHIPERINPEYFPVSAVPRRLHMLEKNNSQPSLIKLPSKPDGNAVSDSEMEYAKKRSSAPSFLASFIMPEIPQVSSLQRQSSKRLRRFSENKIGKGPQDSSVEDAKNRSLSSALKGILTIAQVPKKGYF